MKGRKACITKFYDFIYIYAVTVALQSYRVVVHEEQVVMGNDVLLKCVIPSLEADFVSVESWIDSEGNQYPVNFHLLGKFPKHTHC